MTYDSTSLSATGRWGMVSSENYGQFLLAMGVGMIQRNLLEKQKPTIIIQINDGVWTIQTETALKSTESRFKLGEEYYEETEDGRKALCVGTIEDDKLVIARRFGDETSTITSEFHPEEMKQVYTAKGITSTRIFKRL